jgi:hypothetical protein
VGELKGTKISSSSFSLMTTCILPIAPSHAHNERGEREERKRREKRKREK